MARPKTSTFRTAQYFTLPIKPAAKLTLGIQETTSAIPQSQSRSRSFCGISWNPYRPISTFASRQTQFPIASGKILLVLCTCGKKKSSEDVLHWRRCSKTWLKERRGGYHLQKGRQRMLLHATSHFCLALTESGEGHAEKLWKHLVRVLIHATLGSWQNKKRFRSQGTDQD